MVQQQMIKALLYSFTWRHHLLTNYEIKIPGSKNIFFSKTGATPEFSRSLLWLVPRSLYPLLCRDIFFGWRSFWSTCCSATWSSTPH